MKLIQKLLSTHHHVDGESGEVLRSTKYLSFRAIKKKKTVLKKSPEQLKKLGTNLKT